MANRPSVYVLDSFALLAYFAGEPGMAAVEAILDGARTERRTVYISLINVGEVLYITERERGLREARLTLAAIDQLPLQVVEVSRATVLSAAHVKARFAISYADAFAVVTAQDHAAVVMTGDPEFEPLADAGVVRVAWLLGHPHSARSASSTMASARSISARVIVSGGATRHTK